MRHPADDPVIDVGALRALAHPLRVELYELVSAHGPMTASMLARRLGETSGATSYHLRQLARHGLIEDDPDQPRGRERWWRRPPGGKTLLSPDYLQRSDTRAAATVVLREVNRGKRERQQRFLDEIGTWSDEWQRGSVDMLSNLRLGPAQSHDLVGELSGLIDRYRELPATDDAEAVELQVSVFPKRAPGNRS